MIATTWMLTALTAASLQAWGRAVPAVGTAPIPLPIASAEMPRPDGNLGGTDAGPLLSVAEWGGIRFLQYDTVTYWTADSGRTWRRKAWMDPGTGKGPVPSMPDARFRSTGPDLYLDGGGAPRKLVVYDPAAGEWRSAVFGNPAFTDITAMACDTGRIYVYSSRRGLWRSLDRGISWAHIPVLGDSLDPASAFDRIEAEGTRMLLGRTRPGPQSYEAGSADGGATWKAFPAPWKHRIFEGCFHWVAGGKLRSECDPGGPVDSVAAPFEALSRLFRGPAADLFAFADSALYLYSQTDGWALAGMREDWDGWFFSDALASIRTGTAVRWISGARVISPSVSIAPRSRRPGAERKAPRWPRWLEQGRRPDGRAVVSPLR